MAAAPDRKLTANLVVGVPENKIRSLQATGRLPAGEPLDVFERWMQLHVFDGVLALATGTGVVFESAELGFMVNGKFIKEQR